MVYRERVAALIAGLGRSAEMHAAKEALRALVNRIVLIPAKESTGVEIELDGDLASCDGVGGGHCNAERRALW